MIPLLLICAAFKWQANQESDIYGYNLYRNNEQVAFILHPRTNIVIETPAGICYWSLTALNTSFQESLPTPRLMTENRSLNILISTNLTNWSYTGINYNITNITEGIKYYKLEIK